MTTEYVTIDENQNVEVLSLRPGDTLLVSVKHPLTAEGAHRIKDLIKAQLTVDVPILVADSGTTFSIARAAEADD